MKLLKKERIFIFGSFAFIWILLFSYGYKRYQELHHQDEQMAFFDEQLSVSKDTDLLKSSYSDDDLFTDVNLSKKQESNSFFWKVANAEGNSFSKREKDNNVNILDQGIEYIKKCGNFRCYTGKQFINIYNKFEDNLKLKKEKKSIYGNEEIDSYIRKLAEKRGYKEHVFARSEDIIDFNQLKTRSEVKDAYISMHNEMKKKNISLHFVSGYRGADLQKNIFLRKLGNININKILSGLYDEKIDKVLTKSSIPGYSKHHSGYTVDFGCGNDYLVYSFAKTDCYKWMSKNNFENTKRFGFIPSYPEEVERQGPEPEPWEFVWVGVENIK